MPSEDVSRRSSKPTNRVSPCLFELRTRVAEQSYQDELNRAKRRDGQAGELILRLNFSTLEDLALLSLFSITSTTLSESSDRGVLLPRQTESVRPVLPDGPPPLPLGFVNRWLFVSQAPGPTLTPLAKSLNDSFGSSDASMDWCHKSEVHWEVGAVVDVFVLLDSSMLRFAPDKVHEFMDRGWFKGNLRHLPHRQAHEQLWRAISARRVPFCVGNTFTVFHSMSGVSFQVATCLETPSSGHWTDRARRARFPSRGALLFPTCLNRWVAQIHVLRSQGRMQDPRRSVTVIQKGGLVELTLCQIFRGASPDTPVTARPRGTSANVCIDTEVCNLTTSTTSFGADDPYRQSLQNS